MRSDRHSDLAAFDNWNYLADSTLADQADCQLQNRATWISYLETSRYRCRDDYQTP